MGTKTHYNFTTMVIEDESILLQAITKKLNKRAIETVSCTRAEQALDYLKELDALPNLIWLDYYLPGLTGLEFLKLLKKNKKWAHIPVCIVSNTASDQKVKEMMDEGADLYKVKAESRLEDIVSEVEKFIKK